MSSPRLLWLNATATHEVIAQHWPASEWSSEKFTVGVDCINEDELHVRATSISQHDDAPTAVRHAERLSEIIAWGR